MHINRNNLTIVTHSANQPVKGQATNGLEFTSTGTRVISDGAYYSISVSALKTDNNEPLGVLPRADAESLLASTTNEGEAVSLLKLAPRFIKDAPPPQISNDLKKPAGFELYFDDRLLLKILQNAVEFDDKGVIRVQFVGKDDPIRMEARNSATGQKWEALLMPFKSTGIKQEQYFAERFSEDKEAQREGWGRSCANHGERQAVAQVPVPPPQAVIPVPPPPVEEDEFTKALRIASGL